MRHIEMPKQPPKSPFVIKKQLEVILEYNNQNIVRLPQTYQLLL